ncbi:MAG: HK97 gp10 family phage protein [Acetatifactor muris]|nr:HK97 gp10 family phage protein [Acetatifactor muris]
MSMKSLEDLERAFARGLSEWESRTALEHAEKIGKKCIREIKRKTPHITGNLRRRWDSHAEKGNSDIKIHLTNDADYAAPVNDGHRIVRGGRTVGYKEGHHMLEKGTASYQEHYLKDDLQNMADGLGKAMKG